MEKTPYEEFLCLNGTRGFHKEEKVWNMMNDLAIL
jgi:hypothetical protein